MTTNQVIIINVFLSQVHIYLVCKFADIRWFIGEFNEPLVVGFPFALLNGGSNGKLCNLNPFFLCSLHQAILHFFSNHMFPEGRNKMLDASGYLDPVGLNRNKPDSITYII